MALNVKTRDSYRKYTPKQAERLFNLIIKEGFTAKAADLATEINVCPAQNYVKTYNNDPERRLYEFYSRPHGRLCPKLTGKYSRLVICLEYIKK